MKTKFRISSAAALAVLSSLLLCACEKDKVHDKWEEVKDKAGIQEKDVATDVTGTWTGHSGSGQWYSVMTLTDKEGRVTGTMSWPGNNDSRAVSGTRSGNNLTLYVEGRDVWYLKIKGNSMSGTGDKYGTNRTYALSYSRN